MDETFNDIGPHRGLYYDDQGRPYNDPPGTYGFCKSPSQDEYQAYLDTKVVPPWNPGRHTEAHNPQQCEVAWQLDLVTLKGYREDAFHFGKNIAAGFVNAIVPGSDLGDSYSQGQFVGGILGSAAGLFIPSPNIGMAFNLGGILSSPIVNTIVGSVVGGLVAKPTAANPVVQQQPQFYQQNIPLGTPLVIDTGKGTVSTKPADTMPAWLLPVGLGVAVLLLVLQFVNPFRRRK